MKVALVHDYIKEFGGAERVLKTLTEIYPDAPIYTAFRVKNSTADEEFKGTKIIESRLAPVLKIWRLYSPLRFLAPVIWESFDLLDYDLVITSCSWYITRGFKVGTNTKVIAYCHTPPRWLYGYDTSVGFTKYWPVKIYAKIVGKFMRDYDFRTAQKVDYWIANSKNVQERIKRFYKRDSVVIYPPVKTDFKISDKDLSKDYYLIVSRIVGAKGIEEAISIFEKLGKKLKIVGESYGFSNIKTENLKYVEFLGRVDDQKLFELYAGATAFVALARDEDFGMTVVESQAAGTPVIAFNGGGFKETVVGGVTGVLIDDVSEKTIKDAIQKVEYTNWKKEDLIKNAQKFSKQRFIEEMLQFVNSHAQKDN